MNEPKWLTIDHVLAIHAAQIERFGGATGARDLGLLSSALSQPVNRWNYESADYAQLSAAYAFGTIKNHPFIDGNKRTGFASAIVFLKWNGVHFSAEPADATGRVLSLASGEIGEDSFAEWPIECQLK